MTLGRKILLSDASLLVGLLLLAAAALWGLFRIDRNEQIASQEYQEMRQMSATSARLQTASALLQSNPPDTMRAIAEVKQAIEDARNFQSLQESSDEGSAGHEERETSTIARSIARLNEVSEELSTVPAAGASRNAAALLDRIRGEFDRLTNESDKLVRATQQRSTGAVRDAVLAIAITFLIIVVIGTVISAMQYRSIMRPLRSLRVGVRQIASGQFGLRLTITGDREFLQLADDFNRMAVELDEMYRNLESKVAAKSRELVQSERLASVGFLAAGVAHEINNPLGIMSGFAELSLKRLRNNPDSAAVDDARKSLQIIRDEAFRCREITEQLLILAKGGGPRGPVSLSAVAQDVVGMITAHRNYRGRRVEIDIHDPDLVVCGQESELKQVLLNLVANALNAIDDGTGKVRVIASRDDSTILLRVEDDGCGMSPEVLNHVFEPFYSGRKGENRGVGLGLSITHAIVESHGGTITAQSDGPGLGSRFTVRLPSMAQEVANA